MTASVNEYQDVVDFYGSAICFPCYIIVAMEMKKYVNEMMKDPSPIL